MSSAIQFLEEMGCDASHGRLSAADYAAAVAQLDADEAQRRALMERDHAELSSLLGGRASVMLLVNVATDDDDISDDERSEFVQRSEIHQAA
ncbi:MAG: hypothetical protein ACREPE_05770 [Lysobacter sp.]